MSIEDMKLGNNYIIKAYKGDTLIFDRNAEQYISTLGSYPDELYIPIVDGPAIEFGDTVILDLVPPSEFVNKTYYNCILGGSMCMESTSISSGEMHYGFHISYNDYINSWPYITYGYNTKPGNGGSHITNYTFTPGIRQTLEIGLTPATTSEWWKNRTERTTTPPNITNPILGGFFLFGFRKMFKFTRDTEVVPDKRYFRRVAYSWYYEEIANPSGNPSAQYEWQELDLGPYVHNDDLTPLYSDYCGKFYRITIKDSNNNLKYDFKPKAQNDHIGMIDLVSGNFYPCNDDTKFRIGR